MREGDAVKRAIEGIRGEAVEPEVAEAAARRVWARVSDRPDVDGGSATGAIAGCPDFLHLLPPYLAGRLPASRVALLEDHVASCLACRRALKLARDGAPAALGGPAAAGVAFFRGRDLLRAAAAFAAVAAAAAIIASRPWQRVDPRAGVVTIESVEGSLIALLPEGRVEPVAPGQDVEGRVPLRTTRGSRAVVRLQDGSRVEIRERSELSVSADRHGRTLALDRGAVVVHAARQAEGQRLWLVTPDCQVSVVGTIFSVDRGTMGSRVSVLEGEVHVESTRGEAALRPGDQMATSESLGDAPLAEAFDWSRDRDRYHALLEELAAAGKEIEAAVHEPPLHPASRLLDLMPEDTVVYGAIPNVSDSVAESHRIIQERIRANDVLAPWWAEHVAAHAPAIDEAMEELRAVGSLLGDEIVLAVTAERGIPLLLAEAKDPAELSRRLEARFSEDRGDAHGIRLVEDPDAVDAPDAGLLVHVGQGVVVASPAPALIAGVARAAAGGPRPFAGGPFHARLAAAYAERSDWLLAADLRRIVARAEREGGTAALALAGAREANAIVVQHLEPEPGRTQTRAILSFDGPRRGMASWLAAPAPMGSLDFVSAEARLVAALAVKEPAAMVDDLLGVLRSVDPDAVPSIARLESEAHLRLREDLAAPLGGDVAFAIDGPVLPFPAWKLVVEVYDPVRLQATLEWIVRLADVELRRAGRPGVTLEPVTIAGRPSHRIASAGGREMGQGMLHEVHYALVDGYAVFASQASVLDRTLRNREAGHTIARSPRLRKLLPRDGRTNFSALLYQDLTSVLAEMGGALASNPDPRVTALAGRLRSLGGPGLAYAYAEEDRVVFAADGTSMPLHIDSIVSAARLLAPDRR